MKHLALAFLALTACTDEEPLGPLVVSHTAHGTLGMQYGALKDVLFVVDNSPASAALRPQFLAAARTMLERMQTFDSGNLPNVHVGVITADVADQGRLRQGRYLADELQFDEQRHRNYEGMFVDNALALLDVGSAGSTTLRPLAAIEMAVSPSVNPGFRRELVDLEVIVLTAGDDADARSLDAIHASLAATHSIGVVTACDAQTPRLDSFASGERATLCDADPARVIEPVGAFKQTLEGRCLPGILADVDPGTAGVQHDCASWLTDPLTGNTRAFPECATEQSTNCWAPKEGSGGCDAGYGLELRPRRYQYPAWVELECVVEPPR